MVKLFYHKQEKIQRCKGEFLSAVSDDYGGIGALMGTGGGTAGGRGGIGGPLWKAGGGGGGGRGPP